MQTIGNICAVAAFYAAVTDFGRLFYFHSFEDADAFRAEHGGYTLMTTTGRIWRVTLPL